MIDLHSHILPGVDDGASHIEEAIAMAEAAAADGIRMIAATPHHNNGRYRNNADTIVDQVKELNEEIIARGIPVRVVAGQEIRVNERVWDELQNGNLLPLNGSRYMLIELPTSKVPKEGPELIHELRVAGFIPIIAHPERNAEILDQPDRLQELVLMGALAQLTTHSLLGHFGRKISKLSLELCRRNLIHIIASDAHHVAPRGFNMQAAYDVIRKERGASFEQLLKENASRILDNQVIQSLEPIQEERKRFWIF